MLSSATTGGARKLPGPKYCPALYCPILPSCRELCTFYPMQEIMLGHSNIECAVIRLEPESESRTFTGVGF